VGLIFVALVIIIHRLAKVTRRRHDKINLVLKSKKQSKPVSIIKKKKLTHIFHMCVSPLNVFSQILALVGRANPFLCRVSRWVTASSWELE